MVLSKFPLRSKPLLRPKSPLRSQSSLQSRSSICSQSSTFSLNTPVSALPLVGPRYEERLEKLGITTIKGLLYHFPFRYQDTRDIATIEDLKIKGEGTISALVSSISNTRTRSGKWLTRATLNDDSGTITALWFNQPYLSKSIKVDQQYLFWGKLNTNSKWGSASLIGPQYEAISSGNNLFSTGSKETETTHLGKLSPVYPETYGLSSKWLRARIKPLKSRILSLITETLPDALISKEKLLSLPLAVQTLHFPSDEDLLEKAQHRMAIEELISIRKQAQKLLSNRKREKSIAFNISRSISASALKKSLPFTLTNAQVRCLSEISADLSLCTPMYRLLNGDVGSGKTVLALLAALAVYDSGYSTVIMAPTTILAQQHYETMKTLLKQKLSSIPIQLITSAEKSVIPQEPQITIGTHALIFQEQLPDNIGLIVIDEQHRFGVVQRKKLIKMAQSNKGTSPHYLTMTATPIPRTLTMAIYGTQNVSILNELPPGRIPVKTYLTPGRKRRDAYRWVDDRIALGERVFFICPLIEESEKLEAKSAKTEQERLQKEAFPSRRIGLIHGQMKEKEKSEALEKFKKGEYEILVATPVVEVGIDIPEATIMIIENAERYGLAQLHQLRGRVGRSDIQSYCFLFADTASQEAQDRLTYFSTHSSGFDVAEYDLKRRGPGEVYGVRQSGLLNIHFADISDPTQFSQAERIAKQLSSDV